MLKFKQMNISAYFSSTKAIDFDTEMRRLEKERLLELKRRKEMEWVERRKANKEKEELLMGQKKGRLNKATMSTLSSRTQAWSLNMVKSPVQAKIMQRMWGVPKSPPKRSKC